MQERVRIAEQELHHRPLDFLFVVFLVSRGE